MKRFDSLMLRIFLYGLPALVVFIVFASLYRSGHWGQSQGIFEMLNGLAGIIIALWMALALYLSFRLIVSATFRDQVLSKITLIRERDEREAILTGQASRKTFLTTLAILIFLLCLSCFQVSIYRVPPEQAVNGKTGFITLGLGFNLLEPTKQAGPDEPSQKTDIFSYTGLPVSNTTVLLLLILWQIIFYNYSIRRLTNYSAQHLTRAL